MHMSNPYNLFKDANREHFLMMNKVIRSVRNYDAVPKKATITMEYIRCGKLNCKKCKGEKYYEDLH